MFRSLVIVYTLIGINTLVIVFFFTVLEALFSSLVYKVLNVPTFFYKQHCHLF